MILIEFISDEKIIKIKNFDLLCILYKTIYIKWKKEQKNIRICLICSNKKNTFY